MGIAPEKLYYPWPELDRRVIPALLPSDQCPLIDPEQRGSILLVQPEFMPALLEAIPDRLRIGGIRLGIGGFQRDYAEWQQGNASMKP